MMVMPLGPDFAVALGIPTSELGLIGGSYTAAGAIAGLLGMVGLDRFNRRSALVVALAGLALGTLLGAVATDLPTLMAARVLAGFFGGPATSLALAIVTDVVPAARRGRAMGAVMGAFSAASVLGVPLGLELARLTSWRGPFIVVGALGLVITGLARMLLPSLDAHLQGQSSSSADPGWWARLRGQLARGPVRLALLVVASTSFSSFLVIPNLSALLQLNLGYPREHLGALYLVGGGISFFTMRIAGRLVDRHGSARLMSVGVVAFAFVVSCVGILQTTAIPVVPLFALFMVFQSARNVSQQTLTSRVPRPDERAGFQSLQSAVQHAGSALGAVSSSALLLEVGGRLEGMPRVAGLAIGVAVVAVPLAFVLERQVRRPAVGV